MTYTDVINNYTDKGSLSLHEMRCIMNESNDIDVLNAILKRLLEAIESGFYPQERVREMKKMVQYANAKKWSYRVVGKFSYRDLIQVLGKHSANKEHIDVYYCIREMSPQEAFSISGKCTSWDALANVDALHTAYIEMNLQA